MAALDERYGTSSTGTLALSDLAGSPDQGVVDEFRRQLGTWSVTSTPIADSVSEQRSVASSYDAVAVFVDARDDLGRATALVQSLDRGRAGVVPVLWSTSDGRRS